MRFLLATLVMAVSIICVLLYSSQFLRPMELNPQWINVGTGLYAYEDPPGQVHIYETYENGRVNLGETSKQLDQQIVAVADQRHKHQRLISQGRTKYTTWYDIIEKATRSQPATVQLAQTEAELAKLLKGQDVPSADDFVPAAQWLNSHAKGKQGPVPYRAVLIFTACAVAGVLSGFLGFGRILTATMACVLTLIGSICLFWYALGDYFLSNTIASIILITLFALCVRWAYLYQRRGRNRKGGITQ